MKEVDKKMLARMREEKLERSLKVSRDAVDVEARTVELAFASEKPVDRWFGMEVLDISKDAIRTDYLDSGAALLLDHNWRDQIGAVEAWRIDEDGVARATVKFSQSERAQEILQDIADGIRRHVSVGYRIHEAVLEKQSDSGDEYRITDWEPFEISIVAVPADVSVGVGRSAHTDSAAAGKQEGAAHPEQHRENKEVVMKPEDNNAAPASPVDEDAVRKSTLEAERERVREIEASAERAERTLGKDAVALAREAISAGKSVDEFRADLLEKMNARAAEQRSPIGLTDKEAGSFSFLRLMAHLANPADAGLREAAAFELEVCRATAQRLGRKAKGALVPTDVLSRALTTTGAASTIQTDVLAQSFIDLLRNRMVVRQLGATVLGGLQGNISVPRQSGGATAQWVAEGAAPPQSTQTFDSVTLSPNGVAAETQVTTQTLIQSSIDMEAMIRTDLATVMALAIDLGCINGSGAAGEPLGILNTPGIGSVTVGGAALSNADPLIDLEAAVANANADVGSLSYLTNSHVVAQLKKLKTTTGEYIFNNGSDEGPNFVGDVNGYGVARSNQVPNNLGAGTNQSALLFGNWSDLMIGEWGALDLQVDPYTGGVGNVKIKALQFVDCAVRHPESFAAITDIV